MEIKEILGYAIIAVPFIAIFIFSSMSNGIKETALLFIGVGALVSWVLLGAYFIAV